MMVTTTVTAVTKVGLQPLTWKCQGTAESMCPHLILTQLHEECATHTTLYTRQPCLARRHTGQAAQREWDASPGRGAGLWAQVQLAAGSGRGRAPSDHLVSSWGEGEGGVETGKGSGCTSGAGSTDAPPEWVLVMR